MRKYATLWERIVANTVEPEASYGCWLWRGKRDRFGYGNINVRALGKHHTLKAHIVAFVCLEVGSANADNVLLAYKELVHSGFQVEHACNVRLCCSPQCLGLATAKENNQLKNERKRRVGTYC